MSDSAKLLTRGPSLFILLAGMQPQKIEDWINNNVNADSDINVECQASQGQGQRGNFSITIAQDSWGNGSSYDRVKALMNAYEALRDAGIPEMVEDNQVLNLSTAGPQIQGGRGRVARLALYVNAAYLSQAEREQARGGTTIVQAPGAAMDDQLATLTEQYIEAGGDLNTLPDKPAPVQVAWLKVQLKLLGGKKSETPAETEHAETPAETPAETGKTKAKNRPVI
jgi:hypothetical protein